MIHSNITSKFERNPWKTRVLFEKTSNAKKEGCTVALNDTRLFQFTTELLSWYFKVRNAIQVLQEIASTNSSAFANRCISQLPASNPNLPDSQQQRLKLQRSSSHPPEIFAWSSMERSSCAMVNSSCQTDDTMHRLMFQKFLREEPEKVMLWLSGDPKKLVSDLVVELRLHSANSSSGSGSNRPKNTIISTDWTQETFPPPVYWRSHNHRYSVGDITEGSMRPRSQIISASSTKSLKFQPFV